MSESAIRNALAELVRLSERRDVDIPTQQAALAAARAALAEQPSVRAPMSDWKIAEIYNRWKVTQGRSYAGLLRAVEKHHGIGVKGEA